MGKELMAIDNKFFMNMGHVYTRFQPENRRTKEDKESILLENEINRLGLSRPDEFRDMTHRVILPGRYLGVCLRSEVKDLVERLKRGEGNSVEVLIPLSCVETEYGEDGHGEVNIIGAYFSQKDPHDFSIVNELIHHKINYQIYDKSGNIICKGIQKDLDIPQVVLRVFDTKEEVISYIQDSKSE
jgi:hypothetical protein